MIDTEFLTGVLTAGIIGFVFTYLGIITLNGSYKTWYLGPRIFPPQAIVYGTIPIGIASFEISVISIFVPLLGPDIPSMLVTLLVLPTTLAGLVLAFWRPRWIKPRWVNWLEENYNDRIDILIEDARKNIESWKARVATQEGLEAWAREVAGEPGKKL